MKKNNRLNHNEKGIVQNIVLLVIVVLVVLAALGSYFLLKNQGVLPQNLLPRNINYQNQPSGEEVSVSSKTYILEKEIDQTELEFPDTEFSDLEKELSSL